MPWMSHRKQFLITSLCVQTKGIITKDNQDFKLTAGHAEAYTPRTMRPAAGSTWSPPNKLETLKQPAIFLRRVRFGAFEVDLRTSELRKQGRKIRLQEQPCRILGILLEQRGEVVTREELRKRLWSDDIFVDFDHSLNTAIMRLREALCDSVEKPRFIETLPRHGYRFIVPIEEVNPVEQPGNHDGQTLPELKPGLSGVELPTLLSGAEQIGQEPKTGFMDRHSSRILAALLALSVFAVLTWALRHPWSRAGAIAQPNQIKSVVVLPFENLSGDKDQQYFTDGMTDELIANLAKIRALRVISRTSSMAYQGTHKTLSQIARELNVDAAVEGTVLRSGNRVRITAELVQAATDRHLWADTYESQMGDVLSLQNQVASAIVNEISIKVTPEEQLRLASARPVSAEGYEDYLKGKYYWNKRSEEGLRKAIEYFQLATQKDPQSALAFAGLADCYSIIGSAIVGTVPSAEVAPKARAAALKALELDPSLAEAQTSLATVRFNYDWDWADAANGFQRAIDVNPGYATAYQRYSLYLMAMGRTAESLARMNRARELDPLSISMNFSLGWRFYLAGRYDQAIQQLQNTLEMDPNFALPRMFLGQAYAQERAYPQALEELQKAASLSHDSPQTLGALGYAYGVSGNRLAAEKVLSQIMEESKNRYVSPFYVAQIYVGIHENDKALDWLEKAFRDRSNAVVFLKVDPELNDLRSLPRFQSLLARLGLPE